MANLKKITPNLWFADEAEAAAKFYTSIFNNSSIGQISRYGKAGFDIHKRPAGSVMTVEFALDGQDFLGLNGGPYFKFTEAISFVVNCDTQEEIDYYWEKLSTGGDPKAQQCGWLKDQYGLSWQIVPRIMDDFFVDHQSEKTERAMEAMLQMKKLDIATLQNAFDGK